MVVKVHARCNGLAMSCDVGLTPRRSLSLIPFNHREAGSMPALLRLIGWVPNPYRSKNVPRWGQAVGGCVELYNCLLILSGYTIWWGAEVHDLALRSSVSWHTVCLYLMCHGTHFSAAGNVFGGGRSYRNLLKSFMFIPMPRFIRLLAGRWHVSWFYHQHKHYAGETRLQQFSRQR
jgi:hypothetical protein